MTHLNKHDYPQNCICLTEVWIIISNVQKENTHTHTQPDQIYRITLNEEIW